MINSLLDAVDSFLGRGKYSASVPVMDGPLQPNQALEEAELLMARPGLDNLVAIEDALYFSSGPTLLQRIADGSHKVIASYEQEITCIAANEFAALAVGLDRRGIIVHGGRHAGREIRTVGDAPFICPTSALFLDETTLVVTSGSASLPCAEWKRDLMTLGKSGSVWRIDLSSGRQQLIKGRLAYPCGLATIEDHNLLISEAWSHRLLQIKEDSAVPVRVVLDDLPGYPSRLLPAARGGFWLTVFAPRNQLSEFVLQERGYCEQMISQVDPSYWVAPALSSGASFKEVLQYGAVKRMGIRKAWAPTWSYGLVIRLGADFQPVASWHSRADGVRHGITSVANYRGTVVVSSKGAGEALVLNTSPVCGDDA
jgi:hypothetical protein